MDINNRWLQDENSKLVNTTGEITESKNESGKKIRRERGDGSGHSARKSSSKRGASKAEGAEGAVEVEDRKHDCQGIY